MINKSFGISKIDEYPTEFTDGNRYLSGNIDIANASNDYFSNIGRMMAQYIKNLDKSYREFLFPKTIQIY